MKKKINKKDFLELFIKTHPNTSLDEIKKKKYLLKEGVIDSFGIIQKKTRKKINIGKLKVKDLRDLNSLFKFINK